MTCLAGHNKKFRKYSPLTFTSNFHKATDTDADFANVQRESDIMHDACSLPRSCLVHTVDRLTVKVGSALTRRYLMPNAFCALIGKTACGT